MKIIRPSLEIVTHGGINMELQEAVAAVAENIRRWGLDFKKALSDIYSLFGDGVYHRRKKKRRHRKRPQHNRKRLRQLRRRRRRDQSRKVHRWNRRVKGYEKDM